jgi:endogenous inhibitor of DNA gyrase (YacG/DUF329 family)
MAGPITSCPICKKPVAFNDPYMPFCSDRCRLIDLGNWASEKYAIPGSPVSDEDDRHDPEEPEGPSR